MPPPSLRHVVALAGSAGAFPTFLRQLGRLIFEDHSCLFLIYHRAGPIRFDWGIPLPAGTAFRARMAATGHVIEPNVVYYPHDGDDLEVRDGRLVVLPPAKRYHPNIDRLLTSLARGYGPRTLAVLLSGFGDDGVEGLAAVRAAGGLALAQDPEEATAPFLPRAAIEAGAVDRVLDTEGILIAVEEVLHGAAAPNAVRRARA